MACLKAGEILLLKIYHYNCIQHSSMVSWQSLKARYSKLDSWSSILENFEDQDVQARLRTYQDRLTIICFIHITIALFSTTWFPWNLCLRSLKNYSAVSKLETRSSTRSLKNETQNSTLETQFSKTLTIKNRVSSRDWKPTFERYCTICAQRSPQLTHKWSAFCFFSRYCTVFTHFKWLQLV